MSTRAQRWNATADKYEIVFGAAEQMPGDTMAVGTGITDAQREYFARIEASAQALGIFLESDEGKAALRILGALTYTGHRLIIAEEEFAAFARRWYLDKSGARHSLEWLSSRKKSLVPGPLFEDATPLDLIRAAVRVRFMEPETVLPYIIEVIEST